MIKRQAQIMLAVEKVSNLPKSMKPWFMMIVANAAAGSRERIITLLTHPAIQPLAYQFFLGADKWTADMFDNWSKIDLGNADLAGDVSTAYLAIGHHPDGTCYLYIGSATSMSRTAGAIGEGQRMRVHRIVLAAGPDAIKRERRSGVKTKGSRALLVHELLSECISYFFVAMQRFPMDMKNPSHPKYAALALIAENVNMVLLSSNTTTRDPRRATSLPLRAISLAILNYLRPNTFPDAPWEGANIVLPIMQQAPVFWALLTKRRRLVLSLELRNKLEAHFKEGGDITLTRKEYRSILASEDAPETPSNVGALQELYADVLRGHNKQYLTAPMLRLRNDTTLWSAIISEAEEEGLASGPKNDTYHLDMSNLDWHSVSQRAQSAATPESRKYFSTAADCKKVYNSGKARDFDRKALYRPNWEILRGKFS